MAENTTQYLDLDALLTVEKVLKVGGKEHKLQPVTVEGFVRNVKMVQDLGKSGDLETEMKLIVSMLSDAFPTFPESEMRKLPLDHLNKILAFAQENDGTTDVAKEAEKEAAANPQ